MLLKTAQNSRKIGLGSHRNGDKKKMQKNIETKTGNVENGPQNGSPDVVICWSFGSFFPCQTALGAQMAPKPPPRAPKASPRLDFHRFFVDFG